MKKVLCLVLVLGSLTGAIVCSSFAADATPPASAMSTKSGLVNVNNATKAALEKLPGIGAVLADRIIAGRPYRAVDDLKKIEGLGDKTFAGIKDLVTLE